MLTVVIIWFYFRDNANCFLNWLQHKQRRKMSQEDLHSCLDWLLQEQGELQSASFGQSKDGVLSAARLQKLKQQNINNYNETISKVVAKHKLSPNESKELSEAYDSLKAVSTKRTACMEVMAGVASLEDPIETLASEFDTRAVHLVNLGYNNRDTANPLQSNESMARTAQNCVAGVRNNWRWIDTVLQCSQVHLHNAAAYHQFFHEVEEVEYWMNTTLSRIHLTFDKSRLKGDSSDVAFIQEEMKDHLLAYLQWQSKVDRLFDRAKDIVPVQDRVEKLQHSKPVIALTDYKTSEIEFIEGETLTLVDNSKRDKWKVQNEREQTAMVPAVILLIPSPSGRAIDAAVRLRIQLLALWTGSIKRLGYQMIAFMTLMFRDWSEEEIRSLQSMGQKDKRDLLGILDNIEDTLIRNWNGYGDFKLLQERMSQLRMILEESDDAKGKGKSSEVSSTVVVQVKSLDDLLNRYKDFWAYWETYKVVVELLQQPKYLLVCDKWDQLKYITTAHFVKFWNTPLDLELPGYTSTDYQLDQYSISDQSITLSETPSEPFPDRELERGDLNEVGDEYDGFEEIVQEKVTKTQQSVQQTVPEDETYEMSEEMTETREETTTDQIYSSVEEETSILIIKSIVDTRTNTLISVQEAVIQGILDQVAGTYVNPVTKEVMKLIDAQNEGFVIMQTQSRKRLRKQDQSYGLITIKTTKENRPYTVKAVLDPGTEEEITVAEAVKRGFIDTKSGTYKMDNGDTISIHDAIESGLVKAEFTDGPDATHEAETVTKTYAVHGVIDQKRKIKVSFTDALTRRLLDREDGYYFNNLTREKVPISEAIMKGFIKARLVKDPSKLDINPNNNIVIEKFSNAKSKIMKAMKISKAFKAAANGNT
ncbi:uncharacterized protein LOC134712522 isoform X2 [Mytilus trossulus]|uniref:uncharacterized protein LOC134712522 isoform X2 n=1 Tax=Mytilus trossulus TaxID=6551 RepID=UPI0030077769